MFYNSGLYWFLIFYTIGGLYGAYKIGQWFMSAQTMTQSSNMHPIAIGFGLCGAMMVGAIIWPLVITSDWVYYYLENKQK